MAYESYPQITDPILDDAETWLVYKTQHTNVVQARDVATGAKWATITETLSGLRLGTGVQEVPPEDLIAPENGVTRALRFLDTADRTAATCTLEVDLGREVRLGSAGLRQAERMELGVQYQAPSWLAVWIDPGDGSWVEVLPETDYLDADLHINGITWVDCGERIARRVRLQARGVRPGGNRITLNGVVIRPSLFEPLLRTCDGLPLDTMPRYSYVDTRDVAPGDKVPYNNFLAAWGTAGKGTGWTGKPAATEDAWQIVDLGRHVPLLSVHLHIARSVYASGLYDNRWDFGATIEVCDDAADVPVNWTVAWDTSDPVGDTVVNLASTRPSARWVRVTNKRGTYAVGRTTSGGMDVGGQTGTGLGLVAAIQITGGDPAAPAVQPIAQVTVTEAGPLSLAIANSAGVSVRDLIAAMSVPAGSYPVYWDGLHHEGGAIAAANLIVRGATSRASWECLFSIGNSGPPGDAPIAGHVDQGVPYLVSRFAVVPGNQRYFLASYGNEGSNLFLYDEAGHAVLDTFSARPYQRNVQYVLALAADDEHWFEAHLDQAGAQTYVQRFTYSLADNPAYAASVATVARPDLRAPAAEQRAWKALNHLAAHPGADRLFLSDYRNDRIRTWTKDPLAEVQATALAVSDPLGVAVDPRGGHLWVAHSGDTITCHPIETDGTLGAAVATLSGLNDPDSIAVADIGTAESPDVRLVAVEYDQGRGGARLAEWDITTITAPVRGGAYDGMGTDHAPGPVRDDAWLRPEGLALFDSGDLLIADTWNWWTLRFRRADVATARGASQEPRAYQRTTRDFGPGAYVDPNLIDHAQKRFFVLTGQLEFEVRLDGGTWTPEEGGIGPLTYRLHANWTATADDALGWSLTSYSSTRSMWFPHGPGGEPRRYIVHTPGSTPDTAEGITIVAVEPDGARACAGLHSSWRGVPETLTSDRRAAWAHVDFDGDGVIDPDTEITEGPHDDANTPWATGGGGKLVLDPSDGSILAVMATPSSAPGNPNGYVYGDTYQSICRVPIDHWHDHGDGRFSPVYRWRDITPIVLAAHQPSPLGDGLTVWDATPMVGGTLVGNLSHGIYGYLAVWDAATGDRLMIGPTTTYRGASIISRPDPQGRYIYEFQAGATPWHWGVVRDITTGVAVGLIGGAKHPWLSNWVDNVVGSVWIFDLASTTYALAEDNIQGKLNLYRLGGQGTERIVEVPLAWTGAASWDGTGEVALELTPGDIEGPPDPPDVASAQLARYRRDHLLMIG